MKRIVSILLAMPVVLSGTLMSTSNGVSQYGVRLFGPSSSDFEAQLKQFPVSSIPSVAILAPYSVVVQNAGTKGIVGYALKWKWTSQDGKAHDKTVSLSTPSAFNWSRRAQESKAEPCIRSGGTRLISPSRSFDSGFDPSTLKNHELPGVAELARELASASQVAVSLDLIVFDDGSFAGPDESSFDQILQAQLAANHDLKLEVHRRRQTGASAETIFKGLQALADSSPVLPTSASRPSEWYRFYTQQAAKEILNIRNVGGDASALHTVYTNFYTDKPRLRKL